MRYAIALCLLAITASAHAQLLVPKGSKATLEVQYLYTAEGNSGRKDAEAIDEWRVRRVLNVTAQYVAEEPAALAVLHTQDAGQKAALDQQVKQAEAFGQKMAPTVADMMKIAERCGEDEGCIEKAVADYANTMDVKAMQSGKKEAAAIFSPGTARFQLWKPVAMSGTYDLDELTSRQVFEMTCTQVHVCKRTVTRRGKGPIPVPPGGPGQVASVLEIDGANKDLAAKMPMPLEELPVETKVQSTIPDDDFQPGATWPMHLFKLPDTLTLAIASGQLPASGTKTLKNTGKGAESGTLTVTWTFRRK